LLAQNLVTQNAPIASGTIGTAIATTLADLTADLTAAEIAFITENDTSYYQIDLMPFRRRLNPPVVPTIAPIPLFNAGADATGAVLPDGTIAPPNYAIVSAPGGSTVLRVRREAGGFPIPPYLADSSESAWIGPDNNNALESPPGNYPIQTTFDLSGLNPATANISGRFSVDNELADILINGMSTGNSGSGFGSWTPFTITNGFIAGINTIQFIVVNAGNTLNPMGFRVEMSGTALTA
jgi:hypothetical protein